MANSNNNNTTLLWSGSGTRSLNSTARVPSDVVSINADAVQGALQVTVDNSGTPASGDTVDLWVSWHVNGTLLDTDEHSQFLGRLDTFGSNDPGEDPATKTFTLNVSGKRGFDLVARANQGATRAIAISAIYNEHRMA
jgi:hypothetical protein